MYHYANVIPDFRNDEFLTVDTNMPEIKEVLHRNILVKQVKVVSECGGWECLDVWLVHANHYARVAEAISDCMVVENMLDSIPLALDL